MLSLPAAKIDRCLTGRPRACLQPACGKSAGQRWQVKGENRQMDVEPADSERRPAELPAPLPAAHDTPSGFGPVHFRADDAWRAIAIGAGALVAAVVVLAAVWLLRRPLALLVLGIVIAEAVRPLVDRLNRRLPWVLSILLVFLVILLLVAGVIWLSAPPLAREVRGVAFRMPRLIQELEGWLAQHNVPIEQRVINAVSDQLGRLAGALIELPLAILHSLLELALVVFVAIYWLILTPHAWEFVRSLLPASKQEPVKQVLGDMGRAMGGYVRGVAIVGGILGITTYLLLLLIHVHYPAVLGMLTAVLEFVPVLGATISMTVLVLVALSQSPATALIAFVAALILHQTEVHILVPNVMAKETSISPLLAVLAVFAGGTLGGVLGAILAIPLVAAFHVFVVDVIAPAIRRRTGASEANVV